MRYKKKENEALDKCFESATKHGMNVRLSDEVIFYRKMFHWEYIKHEDIAKMYRRVEEVISHTSCCAENMDIDKLIVTLKDGSVIEIHVCDGERRLAEKLYADITSAWTDIAYGKESA